LIWREYDLEKNYREPPVSTLETEFFDKLERKYNIVIERQYELMGRYYDGRYKNILFESDGQFWHDHSIDKYWIDDTWKDLIADKYGFRLYRFEINSPYDINKILKDNKALFQSIFST
jgi:hypothetical protein